MTTQHPTDELPPDEGPLHVFIAGDSETRVRTMAELFGDDPGVIIFHALDMIWILSEARRNGADVYLRYPDGEKYHFDSPILKAVNVEHIES